MAPSRKNTVKSGIMILFLCAAGFLTACVNDYGVKFDYYYCACSEVTQAMEKDTYLIKNAAELKNFLNSYAGCLPAVYNTDSYGKPFFTDNMLAFKLVETGTTSVSFSLSGCTVENETLVLTVKSESPDIVNCELGLYMLIAEVPYGKTYRSVDFK